MTSIESMYLDEIMEEQILTRILEVDSPLLAQATYLSVDVIERLKKWKDDTAATTVVQTLVHVNNNCGWLVQEVRKRTETARWI